MAAQVRKKLLHNTRYHVIVLKDQWRGQKLTWKLSHLVFKKLLVPCVIECYLVLNGIKWHTISCTGWYYIALYDVNAFRWKQHFTDIRERKCNAHIHIWINIPIFVTFHNRINFTTYISSGFVNFEQYFII